MMQRGLYLVMLPAALLVVPAVLLAADEKTRDEGFTTIFDGKTLDGWHVSSQAYQALIDYHGGGDFTKQFVRYRKIRVKQLDRSLRSGKQ